MVKAFWSRKLLGFGAAVTVGIVAILVMLTVALNARRLDAVLVCVVSLGLLLLLSAGVAWAFGLNHIPRVTTDESTWIKVVQGRSTIAVTPTNIVSVENVERGVRIATREGAFTIDPDCSGYSIVVELARKWLKPSP